MIKVPTCHLNRVIVLIVQVLASTHMTTTITNMVMHPPNHRLLGFMSGMIQRVTICGTQIGNAQQIGPD